MAMEESVIQRIASNEDLSYVDIFINEIEKLQRFSVCNKAQSGVVLERLKEIKFAIEAKHSVQSLDAFCSILNCVQSMLSKYQDVTSILGNWCEADDNENFESIHKELDTLYEQHHIEYDKKSIDTLCTLSKLADCEALKHIVEESNSDSRSLRFDECRVLNTSMTESFQILPKLTNEDYYITDLIKLNQVDAKKLVLGNRVKDGAFGSLYDSELKGIKVSVKVSTMHKLYKEAMILKAYNFPGILRFFGVDDRVAPTLLVTAAFVCSLSDILYNPEYRKVLGDFTLLKKWFILLECCNTLQFLHNISILHRDIKPDNIVVLSNGGVRVTNFGSVSVANPFLFPKGDLVDSTACYMAPELLLYPGQYEYSEATDVYAFGIMMNEILTEKKPFEEVINCSDVDNYDVKLMELMNESNGMIRPTMYCEGSDEFKANLKNILEKCCCNVRESRCSMLDVCNFLYKYSKKETLDVAAKQYVDDDEVCHVDNALITSIEVIGYYSGQMKNNKRHGRGSFRVNDEIYEGDWVDDIVNGFGQLRRDDGTSYVGHWKHGHKCGQGVLCDTEGNVYEGHFKDNLMWGEGRMTYKDGNLYIGAWEKNVKCGVGIMRYTDGAVYVGHWKEDRKNGKGVLNYAEGDVYDGEWVDNIMQGMGKMKSADGIYVGEWKEHNMNGKGKMVKTNGDVYEGEWVDHVINGEGCMKFANGNVYIGQWKEGIMNGTGKMTYSEGNVVEGEWRDGEPILSVHDYYVMMLA